ncbi:hypothetical protein, partial [Mycolicibacterium insubricum]|uniref:hypothetical protein n=1 Tax=Mycolicibacterium insubricum TaxID=444597 RepID=UPI0021F34B0C
MDTADEQHLPRPVAQVSARSGRPCTEVPTWRQALTSSLAACAGGAGWTGDDGVASVAAGSVAVGSADPLLWQPASATTSAAA